MKVHRAETGETFEVDVVTETSVDEVKQALAGCMNCSPGDVILICAGVKLETGRALEYYSLPNPEKEVFMYSRRSLDPSFVIPRPEEMNAAVPTLPQAPPRLEREDAGPLMRTLYTFQDKFDHHVQVGQTLVNSIVGHLTVLERLVVQQTVQARGLEAAIANLNGYEKQIATVWASFHKHYTEQHGQHQALLDSFPSDVEKLRTIAIHPAFRMPPESTLADCVPEQRLRAWAEECRVAHVQLAEKVSGLDGQIHQVREGVAAENSRRPTTDFDDLQARITEARHARDMVVRLMDSLMRDYQQASEQVTRAGEPDPLAAIHALEALHAEHKKSILPSLKEAAGQVYEHVIAASKSKMELTASVYTRLREVSSLQSQIRALVNKIVLYKDTLEVQRTPFQQLLHLQKLPTAYSAWEVEISRRRRFAAVYSTRSQQLVEQVATMREEEVAKRDSFFRMHGRFLPKQIALGLGEQPHYMEVRTQPPDSQLPAIDMGESEPVIDEKLSLSAPGSPDDDDDDDTLPQGSLIMPSSTETDILLTPAAAEKMQKLADENARLKNEIKQLQAMRDASSTHSIETLESRRSSIDRNGGAEGFGAAASRMSTSESFDLDMERILQQQTEFEERIQKSELEMKDAVERAEQIEQKYVAANTKIKELEEQLATAEAAKIEAERSFSNAIANSAHLENLLKQARAEAAQAAQVSVPVPVEQMKALEMQVQQLQETSEEWRRKSEQSTTILQEIGSVLQLVDGSDAFDPLGLATRTENVVMGLKAEIERRISYETFGVNDTCIFARNERGNYVIVSKRKLPMFLYLDPSQQELIAKERPRFVVARIVEELVQLKAAEDPESNPFGVPIGSDFYAVVAVLADRPQ